MKPRALLLLALLGLVLPHALPGTPAARAEVSSEARTAAEIFERKSHVVDCLEYVAGDLRVRWADDKTQAPAELLLVVDPTTTLKDEIEVMRTGLRRVRAAGPSSLRVGVMGLGTGEYLAPSRIPTDATGALAGLVFLPVDSPKSILAGVREAAERFGEEGDGPKALVLISQAFDGGEDDVEETREVLMEAGVAFYCIAGEAGFERAWVQEFEPRDYVEEGLTERYNPSPRKLREGELYYGSEVAFGLVPYRWEFDLAQSDFVWSRPPRYPVPSGFGYWSLGTLCHTSGGRYFIYDFGLPAGHPSRTPISEAELQKLTPKQRKQHERLRKRLKASKTTYDFSRLSLLAPDLRPRRKILKDLSRDRRVQTIIRIWEHLANDALPILQRLGALERRGGTLLTRPERPVRSSAPPLTWLDDLRAVKKAQGFLRERLRAVEASLKWWESANGRERKVKPGADPLNERIEADFQFLGVQLRKVRFHHNEAIAVLKTIKAVDLQYRRARILPKRLFTGVGMPKEDVDLKDDVRNARFAEVLLAQARMANQYPNTPWSAILKKGWIMTFRKDIQIIQQERGTRRTRPKARDRDSDRKGKNGKKPPPKQPKKPPPKPPPGPRPGSGGGGPVTGG